LFYKLRDAIQRSWFNRKCKDILSLPPLDLCRSPLAVVSMVSHKDMLMYLLAVKSLCRYLHPRQVIVISDGSLTADDGLLLSHHLPNYRLLHVRDIKSGVCPSGGTWERLVLISELVQSSYVIQVDSDTLTLDRVEEVQHSIVANTSFTLGTGMGRAMLSMREVTAQMQAIDDTHIQVVAEQSFCKLAGYDELRYVRGCSGFAGFAQGSFNRARLESFAHEMSNILGERWSQWGSEQVASNFFVANSSRATVLPYPKYANVTPGIPWEDSVFLHFIGTYRFKRGVYIKTARKIIRTLGNLQ
jgi:hypothetical protein